MGSQISYMASLGCYHSLAAGSLQDCNQATLLSFLLRITVSKKTRALGALNASLFEHVKITFV